MRLAAAALLLLSACSSTCDIDAALKDFAGPGAKNCGSAEAQALGPPDESLLQACYVEALMTKIAFYGKVSGQGTDSRYAEGWACDGTTLARFTYDSCPSGCGDGDPHLFRTVCTSAVTVDGHIDCAGEKDEEQICP